MSQQVRVARSPGSEVVEALADAEGVEPTELEYAIHEYIDPEALDGLLEAGDSYCRVEFAVADHVVTVDRDGTIHVDGTEYA
jgi:hypothetical protein